MNYKPFVIFLAIILTGLAVFAVVSAGYYPIAFVDGQAVFGKQFKREYGAAASYYEHVLQTYEDEEAMTAAVVTPREVQASVLTQLIENILVRREITRELGEDLVPLRDARLSRFKEDQRFQEAASALYGLAFADVQEIVLVPQTERDMLRSRLFLKGTSLEDWLIEAKRAANVRLFAPGFAWDGTEVKAE